MKEKTMAVQNFYTTPFLLCQGVIEYRITLLPSCSPKKLFVILYCCT
jgi:hypothetical protein